MEVSKTDYLQIDFDQSSKTLKALWFEESENLDQDGFKKELYKWADLILQHKPDFLLVDSRKMQAPITPDIQTWFVTDIFTKYAEGGVIRNAFIESEEVFTAVSIEQTIEENKNAPFETMYFNSVEEAKKWLYK